MDDRFEIETGAFFRNKVLMEVIDDAKARGKSLHLMGLISDGQVHSSLTHLYALLKMAKDHALERVYVHCFLDGRDTPPSSGAQYVSTDYMQPDARFGSYSVRLPEGATTVCNPVRAQTKCGDRAVR